MSVARISRRLQGDINSNRRLDNKRRHSGMRHLAQARNP